MLNFFQGNRLLNPPRISKFREDLINSQHMIISRPKMQTVFSCRRRNYATQAWQAGSKIVHLTSYTVHLIVLCLFLSGCGGDDRKKDFDRTLILKNQAENLIIPAYETFRDRITALNNSFAALKQKPGINTLTAAQNAWKNAKLAWKVCEVYNFGPGAELGLETAFDRWPANKTGIEAAIANYQPVGTYLTTLGSNVKALPALEYLLYHESGENTVKALKENVNRINYLVDLGRQLAADIAKLSRAWADYQVKFSTDVGNKSSSGTTLLANKMVFVLEIILKNKLKQPAGIGVAKKAAIDKVESPYARISAEAIRQNLVTLQATFNGGSGQGFDDYLDALNIKHVDKTSLSKTINKQFETAIKKVDSFSGSLSNQIVSRPEVVKALADEVQKLIILVKVDMISQLGILTIFSDNDGD